MTPAKGKIADTQFASWSTPEAAWRIEYPPEILNQIRAYACDSLRDVGGVLYGSRTEGVVRILAWRRIPCEYAHGDALLLSSRDRLNLAVEFEAARSNPDLKDLRPVGWFVSHPRGSVAMTPSDQETFSNFFPESAQATLVLHPTGSGAKAGFFLRESDGSVRAEASYKEFVIEPIGARSDAPSAPPLKLNEPAAKTQAPILDAPVFHTDEPLRARDRWLWAIPILLVLGIAGWLLYQEQSPAPAPAPHLSIGGARTAPPVTPAPAAAPSAISADPDAQEQIRQLKADLGKERARADELQNLVRILEDRLNVQTQQRQSKP